MDGNIEEGLKLLGAGMAAIGMLGPGIGIGWIIGCQAVEAEINTLSTIGED